MNEIITVNYDTQTVSARELHEKLNIGTAFKDWFPRMCEYGFVEEADFNVLKIERVQIEGTREVKRELTDYNITLDMAKQICMIQRTPEGKRVRQHLIDLEKAWNTPELVMARALKVAEQTIDGLKNQLLEMKPKALFADAVSASESSILVRDLAKLIRQNGVQIGEKRLYRWMREHGYICKGDTMPTQKAMELGLFEIIVRTVERGNGLPIETKTAKVTGKGQIYFVQRLLEC